MSSNECTHATSKPNYALESTRQSTTVDGTHIITNGGKDRLVAATALHGEIFKTDPVLNYLLCDFPSARRRDFIPEYIGSLLKAASLNGAIFDEAWTGHPSDDTSAPPSSSAVWLPPGCKVDNWKTYWPAGLVRIMWKVGISGILRALGDFQSYANKAKKKGLGRPDGSLTPCWYLFFIATAIEARGRGVASHLISRFQEDSRREGKGTPLWLEATTDNSRKLYERCGFELVDTWLLGQKIVDANGDKCGKNEAAGVRVWAMVWWPEASKKTS